MKKVDNRSRSRSPRSRSREQASQHSGERCSQTMRKESYSSEEDNIEDLAEVSEETHRLLTDSCTRGVSSETRKRTRSHFKFPKVDATRSLKLDAVLKSVTSQSAQSADNELARLQTFILDVLEGANEMAVQDVREALITASMLIGNANAKLTRLQREKLISAINDNLTPLIQDESQFTDVAPYLFGSDFVKQAKEYLDQVRALKSTLIDIEHEEPYDKRPLFCEGPPRRGNRPEEGPEDPSIKSKCTNREQGTLGGGHSNPSTEQYTHNSQCKNAMSKYKCHSVSDSCNGDNTPNHTSKSSGSAGTLSIKLGKSNKGPVGHKYSEGVRNRIFINTPSNTKTLPCPTKPDPTGVGIPRDQRHDLKRGSDRITDPTSGRDRAAYGRAVIDNQNSLEEATNNTVDV